MTRPGSGIPAVVTTPLAPAVPTPMPDRGRVFREVTVALTHTDLCERLDLPLEARIVAIGTNRFAQIVYLHVEGPAASFPPGTPEREVGVEAPMVALDELVAIAGVDRPATPIAIKVRGQIRDALNELGVPNADYPAPVANAVGILERTLATIDEAHPPGEAITP